jgi:DNA helicase-2/ATP-dependent DNA helicase PcrA
MISLMTLHAAKGLEFNNVFLPGWEEEVFPNRRSVDDGGGAAVEEERRLAYVGLTRARRRVWICHASSRRVYNQWLSTAPSRFIDELPEDLIDRRMEDGLYGGLAEPGLNLLEGNWGESNAARGPGFQRMRANKGSADRSPSGSKISTVSAVTIGERVFHQKFGYGTVVSSDGGKLEIDFEKAGTKKVLESFVEPT